MSCASYIVVCHATKLVYGSLLVLCAGRGCRLRIDRGKQGNVVQGMLVHCEG